MTADTLPPRTPREELMALAQAYSVANVHYVVRSSPDTLEAARVAKIRLEAGIAVVCDELEKLKRNR